MKIRQRSSSFYFLSELLFVILCFALGSVLCVRLFALASAKHYLALDQNQALRLAQPLAEQLRTHSGMPLNTLWPQCESDACAWRSDENGMPQVFIRLRLNAWSIMKKKPPSCVSCG